LSSKSPHSDVRRYDLDWLRVLVIGLLIPFHTAIIFDVGADFYVKNAEPSRILTEAANAIGVSGMPLLFFVAGAAAWFALRKYGLKRFLEERAARLLLPLIISFLTILPLMGYFGRRFHSGIKESFWDFYPSYFSSGPSDLTGFDGRLSPGHLWFILFLFVLTTAALPLFAWLIGSGSQAFRSRAARFLSRKGVLLMGPVGLLVLDGLPELAGHNVFAYMAFLVAGFLWMTDLRIQESVEGQRHLLGVISVIAGFLFVVLRTWGERQSGFTTGAAAFDLLRDTFIWTTVMAVFGFSYAHLNRPGRAVRYLGRASYPLYILHLPIVIAIGFFVTAWDSGPATKFLSITVASFAATLLAYGFLWRLAAIGRHAIFGPLSDKDLWGHL
jgi:glucan biosynthesis protein C